VLYASSPFVCIRCAVSESWQVILMTLLLILNMSCMCSPSFSRVSSVLMSLLSCCVTCWSSRRTKIVRRARTSGGSTGVRLICFRASVASFVSSFSMSSFLSVTAV